jgi:hypothetical protein
VAKKVGFVSDKMLYVILRIRWCHVIFLKVHAPIADKINDDKDSF